MVAPGLSPAALANLLTLARRARSSGSDSLSAGNSPRTPSGSRVSGVRRIFCAATFPMPDVPPVVTIVFIGQDFQHELPLHARQWKCTIPGRDPVVSQAVPRSGKMGP